MGGRIANNPVYRFGSGCVIINNLPTRILFNPFQLVSYFNDCAKSSSSICTCITDPLSQTDKNKIIDKLRTAGYFIIYKPIYENDFWPSGHRKSVYSTSTSGRFCWPLNWNIFWAFAPIVAQKTSISSTSCQFASICVSRNLVSREDHSRIN